MSRSILVSDQVSSGLIRIIFIKCFTFVLYFWQLTLCVLLAVLALAVAAPHRQRRQFDGYMGGAMAGYGM